MKYIKQFDNTHSLILEYEELYNEVKNVDLNKEMLINSNRKSRSTRDEFIPSTLTRQVSSQIIQSPHISLVRQMSNI